MGADALKHSAAQAALERVESGMRLGLGTGSTASAFVRELGEKARAGLDVVGVPTSEATRALAESVGIRLSTLEQTPELDLTVDGADEIDPRLRLIKGGGGALLREKIVAAASKRMMVIAEDSKLVEQLGRFPLPLEVAPFGHEATRQAIASTLERLERTASVILRKAKDGAPFRTDNGNLIYDCHLDVIHAPERLAETLDAVPGVIGHGLFLNLCTEALIARAEGVETIKASEPSFAGGRNVAMKVPPDEYDTTLSFYRDTLGLPVTALSEGSHVVAFGPMRLWLDRESSRSQAEVWLEIVAHSQAEAAGRLARDGVVRCDSIEPLPDGFRGFWVKNPAGIVHLVCEPAQDG